MKKVLSLIVYGSLLDPTERSNQGLEGLDALPVIVRGFRRSFCQMPSWRSDSKDPKSVLSVEDQPNSEFNAILLTGLTSAALSLIDLREMGYTRIRISRDRVTHFTGQDLAITEGEIFLYRGKPEKRDFSLLPNMAYLDICLRGARNYGDSFADFFMASTFVGQQSIKNSLRTKLL